jgi:hypothetical protein
MINNNSSKDLNKFKLAKLSINSNTFDKINIPLNQNINDYQQISLNIG